VPWLNCQCFVTEQALPPTHEWGDRMLSTARMCWPLSDVCGEFVHAYCEVDGTWFETIDEMQTVLDDYLTGYNGAGLTMGAV
jgi:hypothetical protein